MSSFAVLTAWLSLAGCLLYIAPPVQLLPLLEQALRACTPGTRPEPQAEPRARRVAGVPWDAHRAGRAYG